MAAGLRREYGVAVQTVAADLSTRDGQDRVSRRLSAPTGAERPVDMLVNNAGIAPPLDFADTDPHALRGSKAYVTALTKGVALSLGTGVPAMALCPGPLNHRRTATPTALAWLAHTPEWVVTGPWPTCDGAGSCRCRASPPGRCLAGPGDRAQVGSGSGTIGSSARSPGRIR